MNLLRRNPSTVEISHKKVFIMDQACSNCKDCCICEEPSDVLVVARTQHPATGLVLGADGSNGKKMPPVFLNSSSERTKCLKTLRNHILLPITRNFDNGGNVFQQDGTPGPTSNKVQTWMGSKMRFWPSQSHSTLQH